MPSSRTDDGRDVNSGVDDFKSEIERKRGSKEEGKEKSGAKTTGIGTRAGGVTRCRRRKSLLLPSDLLDGGDDGDDDNGEFELPLTHLMKG